MSKEDTKESNRKGKPNYPPEYKRQVAVAACEPNISVAKLAQAHGLNPNMVFKWRREYRAGGLGQAKTESTVLIPVDVTAVPALGAPASTTPQMRAPTAGIEIELNGALVRLNGTVDPVQLRLVLRCLMPA